MSESHEEPLQEMADEELMHRYGRGEVAAFDVLFARYKGPLFAFLYRYLNHWQHAEDVFQEVFLEVIRHRRRYRRGHRFSSWIFRIARNRAIDRMRRERVRNSISLNDPKGLPQQEGESLHERIPTHLPDPEKEALGGQLRGILRSALHHIPPEQREALCLKEYSGLSIDEIAAICGVSRNTIKSRLRYALEHLKDLFLQMGVM